VSIVLLVGIELLYMTVYCVLLPPTAVGCAVTRFIYGAAYTVCYASIFVKINRIVRIFKMATASGEAFAHYARHCHLAGCHHLQQVTNSCSYDQLLPAVCHCFPTLSHLSNGPGRRPYIPYSRHTRPSR
jgi:hypothetical protein